MTPEGRIEDYLEKQCKKRKYLCYKFVSPGNRGVPDRIVVGGGKTIFVELKAPGEEPRELQKYVIRKLRDNGATVYVIDSEKEIDELLNSI